MAQSKMTCEHWKDVVGYEELYRVSDLGRIRSLRTNKIMKTRRNYLRGGYCVIKLSRDGKKTGLTLHRLVLEAFVGLRPYGHQARHFPNKDRTDNRLANLQWGTPNENKEDMKIHSTILKGENHPCSVLNDCKVLEIRERHKEGNSIRELARKYDVHPQTIRRIVRRTRWSHV